MKKLILKAWYVFNNAEKFKIEYSDGSFGDPMSYADAFNGVKHKGGKIVNNF